MDDNNMSKFATELTLTLEVSLTMTAFEKDDFLLAMTSIQIEEEFGQSKLHLLKYYSKHAIFVHKLARYYEDNEQISHPLLPLNEGDDKLVERQNITNYNGLLYVNV